MIDDCSKLDFIKPKYDSVKCLVNPELLRFYSPTILQYSNDTKLVEIEIGEPLFGVDNLYFRLLSLKKI